MCDYHYRRSIITVNYREILRLDSLGYSQHQIAANVHSSRNTIHEVLHASKMKGLTWPLEDTLTNEEILTLLFPAKVEMATKRRSPIILTFTGNWLVQV